MAVELEKVFQHLEAAVVGEGTPVTSAELSQAFEISADASKLVLYAFIERRKDKKVEGDYVVSGKLKDGGVYCVEQTTRDSLEEVKSLFEEAQMAVSVQCVRPSALAPSDAAAAAHDRFVRRAKADMEKDAPTYKMPSDSRFGIIALAKQLRDFQLAPPPEPPAPAKRVLKKPGSSEKTPTPAEAKSAPPAKKETQQESIANAFAKKPAPKKAGGGSKNDGGASSSIFSKAKQEVASAPPVQSPPESTKGSYKDMQDDFDDLDADDIPDRIISNDPPSDPDTTPSKEELFQEEIASESNIKDSSAESSPVCFKKVKTQKTYTDGGYMVTEDVEEMKSVQVGSQAPDAPKGGGKRAAPKPAAPAKASKQQKGIKSFFTPSK